MAGTNDTLMGIALAQAEHTRKSGWLITARILQDMVGYCYSILRALLYAIALIAFLIPGMRDAILATHGMGNDVEAMRDLGFVSDVFPPINK